ncbi:MAG: sigma 54-interacting transcriptional regulator [Myxococcales bacterium]|nr:sigma 54-interacting transcriptional regulator [Polyangiaceae bacterium]MDW8250828.1 sigma 54-interacting transcriptional regulator [Myxococcales bacterium]
MAVVRRNPTETEDHPRPQVSPSRRGQEALIAVFPSLRGLPMPPRREAVGRSWLAAAGLVDRRVSEPHLVFSSPGGGCFVEDAGSHNGTWLNGVRLRPGERAALPDGTLLRVGSTLLLYREGLRGGLEPSPPLGRMIAPYGLRGLVEMLAGFQRIPPRNVLLEGESGTGKELASELIASTLGKRGTLGAVNLAAIPSTLFEAYLFGHVAGAFSGANRASRRVIAAHDGGAIFLDEIGELPLELQPKLLRLLENREVQPVGAERVTRVDVLVIAATNRSLEEAVRQGSFRADLLARLLQARVELPPLRERPEDVLTLVGAAAASRGFPLAAERVEVEAAERLVLHPWRLNLRELQATVDRLMALDPGALRLWAVEQVLGPPSPGPRAGMLVAEQVERVLAECRGNESEAARRLGVSRGKLRRFLARGA